MVTNSQLDELRRKRILEEHGLKCHVNNCLQVSIACVHSHDTDGLINVCEKHGERYKTEIVLGNCELL